MGGTSLYEEDVFAWSEQQATALRRLARRRDLPNELDLAHVAEEIEDLGISQLHAVRSLVRLILVHAIKAWADPHAPSVPHWEAEIGNWHTDLIDRMTRSMQPKIDMALTWRRALHQANLELAAGQHEAARARVDSELAGSDCPITLPELLGETLVLADLTARIESRRDFVSRAD